jgi:Ubiquitin-conjugating enzyme
MDAFALRLSADRERLQALADASGGKIVLQQLPSPARPKAALQLRYRTAASNAYPASISETTSLVLDFAARYPFIAPVARLTSPILHPNVWESGVICLGAKWLPSEGLDLFVQRIARLLTFDPLLVNEQSAANRSALSWYQQAKRRHPQAFPSDRIEFTAAATTTVVHCPHCPAKLRLPTGKRGTVVCPKCSSEFEART